MSNEEVTEALYCPLMDSISAHQKRLHTISEGSGAQLGVYQDPQFILQPQIPKEESLCEVRPEVLVLK